MVVGEYEGGAVEPLGSGVSKQYLRFTAEVRNNPGVPVKLVVDAGVRHARSIGRKCRAHFQLVVVCKLYRFAARKYLDVNLAGPEPRE